MKQSIYTSLPLREKLIGKVMIFYQTVWSEKKFTASNHKAWLSNFHEEERLPSLYLLSKFMFFGQEEIRELLHCIYRDKFRYKIIESIRKANGDTTDLKFINEGFENELNISRFVSLGGPSESGSLLLYLFRQINNLSTRFMKSSTQILNGRAVSEPSIKNYIFIDDFCGSGETAIKCNSIIDVLKSSDKSIKVSYFVLFATDEGFENVLKFSKFDNVETIFNLDYSFKCFEDVCRYFNETYNEIDKDFTKEFVKRYGYPLVEGSPVEGHPLGFAEGQLLLAFSHNTPDNTLPIFWSDKEWIPFFKRYIKKS